MPLVQDWLLHLLTCSPVQPLCYGCPGIMWNFGYKDTVFSIVFLKFKEERRYAQNKLVDLDETKFDEKNSRNIFQCTINIKEELQKHYKKTRKYQIWSCVMWVNAVEQNTKCLLNLEKVRQTLGAVSQKFSSFLGTRYIILRANLADEMAPITFIWYCH